MLTNSALVLLNIPLSILNQNEGGLFQEKLNLPTVVCGPGSIDQAHKANEYISIDQLEKGGKFLDDLINSCR